EADEFAKIVDRVRPGCTLSERRLKSLFTLTRYVCERDLAGDIVDVGPGGAAALFEQVIEKYSKRDRKMRRGEADGDVAMLHIEGEDVQGLEMMDRVVAGGFVQISDYAAGTPCQRAVHEFEQRRGLEFHLNFVDSGGVWMRKG